MADTKSEKIQQEKQLIIEMVKQEIENLGATPIKKRTLRPLN